MALGLLTFVSDKFIYLPEHCHSSLLLEVKTYALSSQQQTQRSTVDTGVARSNFPASIISTGHSPAYQQENIMAADLTTATAAAIAAAPTTTAATSAASKSAVDKQQQQSDSGKQSDSSHTITAQCQPAALPKTLHTLLGIPEHVCLSQIELIYRAEGNANLVLALPQFKKVLRLPKMLPNSKQQQKREEEQQQQRTASGPVLNENARAGYLTMADFAAYIEIIRLLLGNEFIFEAEIVQIPRKADRDWINDHIKLARPAHRRDKEFCGQFGLLLPDATQLPAAFDILLGNLQPRERAEAVVEAGPVATLTGDTYAVEIKPKQGWLLPTDVNDLFDTIKPTTATAAVATTQTRKTAWPATTEGTAAPTTTAAAMQATTTTTSPTSVATQTLAKIAKTDTRCRYCTMQYLKLQQHKISRLSSYCPIELFSGTPARMLAALHALFECPQNNLRVFRNGDLIYGDHVESISWQQLKDTVFQGDKLQLIKHLLLACLLRDYGSATAGGGEADEADEVVAAVAEAAVVVKAVAGQPHSSATAAPPEPRTEPPAAETETTQTQTQISEAEMLCLPENCVLEKILHLQLLVKRNLDYMWQAGYARLECKSYTVLDALLSKCREVSFESLRPVEEYLLGATALDCSIMLTFQEVCSEISLPPHPLLVELSAYKKCYYTKVTLMDLDPKPDSHFCKYVKQSRQSNACQKQS